jgi:CheY-like chemotaxis protein
VSVSPGVPLMIIDDDNDLRDALADVMAAVGYEVAAFDDAKKALTALEHGLAPFLILLDLMMPGMSGWDFRAAQLEDPKLAAIPVVVVTAATSVSAETGTLGDVAIVHKPFALDSLLPIVVQHADAARLRHEPQRAPKAHPDVAKDLR